MCPQEKETHILVFDMGGGTFDVASPHVQLDDVKHRRRH